MDRMPSGIVERKGRLMVGEKLLTVLGRQVLASLWDQRQAKLRI